MRNSLLSAVAAVTLTTGALAADLPGRAPAAAPAPIFVSMNWTGFYVGGQVGYAWSRDRVCEFSNVLLLGIGGCKDIKPNGMVGGLHAGYNQQFGLFVLGIEADIEATSKRATVAGWPPVAPRATLSITSRTDFQGSARIRAGYSFGQFLPYITAGVAFANVKNTYTDAGGPAAISFSSTRTGFTLGAGIEYMLSNNLSVRAEYRYTDFGRKTDAMPVPGFGFFGTDTFTHKLTDNTIRVGLSYRFGEVAQSRVVAKY